MTDTIREAMLKEPEAQVDFTLSNGLIRSSRTAILHEDGTVTVWRGIDDTYEDYKSLEAMGKVYNLDARAD